MEKKNYIKQPALLLFLTILFVYGASYIPEGTTVLGFELKKVDVFERFDSEEKTDDSDFEFEYDPNASLFENSSDEFAYATLGGNFFEMFNETTRDILGNKFIHVQPRKISGNTEQLKHFKKALANAKNRTVRIGHFGDSIIGGDLLTMDLREYLQTKYGGNAVGYMSIASDDVKYRATTKHTYSERSWKNVQLNRNPRKLPVGIDGSVYIPQGNAWVEYEVTDFRKRLNGYRLVKLFYSHAKPSSIKYSFDGAANKEVKLMPGEDLKEATFSAPSGAKKVRIEFPLDEQAYVYGVSLESGNGVVVDNFSFKGQTGEKLNRIEPALLSQFNRYINYDLLLFQFGLNVIDKISKNPKKYEQEMIKVINNFKKAFPTTSIVLVGVSDKGFKHGNNITTDPNVLKLLAVQQSIVKKTNIAFWNLFEAMGGKDSMKDWVTANPPLASIDYTHFNSAGTKQIAELLGNALIDK